MTTPQNAIFSATAVQTALFDATLYEGSYCDLYTPEQVAAVAAVTLPRCEYTQPVQMSFDDLLAEKAARAAAPVRMATPLFVVPQPSASPAFNRPALAIAS